MSEDLDLVYRTQDERFPSYSEELEESAGAIYTPTAPPVQPQALPLQTGLLERLAVWVVMATMISSAGAIYIWADNDAGMWAIGLIALLGVPWLFWND